MRALADADFLCDGSAEFALPAMFALSAELALSAGFALSVRRWFDLLFLIPGWFVWIGIYLACGFFWTTHAPTHALVHGSGRATTRSGDP